MPELPARSLLRNPDLIVAAVYEREVAAGLSGVWENVEDWEHLPWLHDQTFRSIRLIESGDWGWCAEMDFSDGGQSVVELVIDRRASCYVARTVEGKGAPSEVWTSLRPVGEADDPGATTQIHVEFCVSTVPAKKLAAIGQSYLASYTHLWDQDEEMMKARAGRREEADRAQSARAMSGSKSGSKSGAKTGSKSGPRPGSMSVDLGHAADLRPRVPMRFDFDGHSFRLVEVDGAFFAHSTECPHWGGPLSECEVEKGEITCPWHGYRFNVVEGYSSEGRGLRLRPAPRIVQDSTSGRLTAIR